ncbi:AbrB/MazE/SpoVT family DNA-binding domain-containing protein [Clostridium gasigenes]|uniref:AbrB/MazE/SpoVT family DNA-binding domain-containing protein n=1 Tax=Clostridium gasigenes TaxID=94869 RepID=UPI001C0CEA7E|nr:AbrB/MazE/SpoVT family DNA-binding domain-containing protein [Clostridium gasigenes]MBU3131564.1 AbrB/MazE/SpoVT family DNA-binding domain-containing protein [Clostridium gasigenes]
MRNTGIVRKIDDLGRLCIPKELRKVLNIDIQDPLEIYMDGEMIVLKKYEPACIFCGESNDITEFKGKRICKKCKSDLK